MKNHKSFRKGLIVLLAVFFLILTSNSVFAASSCNGLSKTKCGISDCTWMNGYKKKDGSKVKGYCRTKAKSNLQKKRIEKTNWRREKSLK